MRRREQKQSEQRAKILDAAHDLFSRHGFDAVTMAEIADQAGVSRATVFNYFGSKGALVEAITSSVLGRYGALLENALDDDTTPVPDLLRALFEQMGRGIEADPRFYRGVFREISRLQLGFDERGPSRPPQNVVRLTKLLEKGQQKGQLSRSHRVEELSLAFDVLVNGVITTWLYGEAEDTLHERMRRAAEIFLSPVAVQARPSLRVLDPAEAAGHDT